MACFISAGHHNKDSGAIGVDGRKESEEAVKLRDAVVKYCKEKGLKVITDDDDETLSQYLTIIVTGDGSVVLEFHFDAFDKIASVTTALVGNDADRLDKLFAKRLSDFVSATLEIPNRGVRSESQSHRGSADLPRRHRCGHGQRRRRRSRSAVRFSRCAILGRSKDRDWCTQRQTTGILRRLDGVPRTRSSFPRRCIRCDGGSTQCVRNGRD